MISTRVTPPAAPGATILRLVSIRQLVATALCALPLTGCFKGLTEAETTLTKFGAISVQGVSGPGGTTTATANAIFFDAYSASIPDSRVQPNSCQYALVDTSHAISSGTMKAGASLSMAIGAGSNTTTRDLAFDTPNYRYFNSTPVTYTTNDSVTITIPGDVTGFPANTIKVRMAEPLIPQDVTVPTAGGNMTVKWNAAPDTTGAIIVAVRYANPATMTYANEQIICSLKDDGTEDILGSALGAFQLSPPALRSIKLTRWRTFAFKPSTYTLLHLVSTVDTIAKLK